MSAASRGGRRASFPEAGWEPGPRLAGGDHPGTWVRFTEELSGKVAEFDFTALPVAPVIQHWMARALARSTGPRSGVKRIGSARGHYFWLTAFARCIAETEPAVLAPAELDARHIADFRAGFSGKSMPREAVKGLRVVLRGDPDLPEAARAELFDTRLPEAGRPSPVTAYSDADWQVIMTGLRRDVRGARDRIRAGREVLARFRSGEIGAGHADFDLGRMLDQFDRTSDCPRYTPSCHVPAVYQLGGFRTVALHLCMSLREATAFWLLLAALTGENAGTIAEWPAVHQRPGGTGQPGVVLVEESKPRRGPEREHMVAALEDVPPSLTGLLEAEDEDHRLFRSPLRVYLLLLELGEVARRHARSGSPFTAFGPKGGTGRWTATVSSKLWAAEHGFPRWRQATPGSLPAISTRRIRQTVIEQRRRPVAHTRQTMNDHYLARSSDVQAESRTVVGAALREQVEAARAGLQMPVFTAGFLARARDDLPAAAAEAGLDPDVLAGLASGARDTALAGCTDHRASPHAPAGMPCPASFLTCLDCPNARALPRHLPVQIAVADQIKQLRAHMDPATWRARYGPRLDQLAGIITAYTAAEQQQARQALDARQRQLVDDLLDGRLDLR